MGCKKKLNDVIDSHEIWQSNILYFMAAAFRPFTIPTGYLNTMPSLIKKILHVYSEILIGNKTSP